MPGCRLWSLFCERGDLRSVWARESKASASHSCTDEHPDSSTFNPSYGSRVEWETTTFRISKEAIYFPEDLNNHTSVLFSFSSFLRFHWLLFHYENNIKDKAELSVPSCHPKIWVTEERRRWVQGQPELLILSPKANEVSCKTTLLIKCLPCKHEDPSSDPQHPFQSWEWWHMCVSNHALGNRVGETGRSLTLISPPI